MSSSDISPNSEKNNILQQRFHWAATTPSDIYEHVPRLYEYSKQCQSIVECGVRNVVSSWGFLKGLVDGANQVAPSEKQEKENGGKAGEKKSLTCADLKRSHEVNDLERVAHEVGVQFSFVEGDDIKVELPEADLYFIDTWHIYGHLKRELERFRTRAKRYIIMHDTEVDGVYGETLRCWPNRVAEQAQQSGYAPEEITKGLLPAIDEFLAAHGQEWELVEKLTNCNGLTVLRRRGGGAQ